MARPITALLLIFLSAQSARADSDGYFCAGKTYIAYQFGLAAPPVAPHNLFVVRFDASGALITPILVQLPQFQVHGMRCLDDRILVASFDSLYSVGLDQERRPLSIVATALRSRGSIPPELVPQRNLAHFSQARDSLQVERHLLARDSVGVSFVLEIAPQASAKPCEVVLRTRLLKLGRDGEAIATHLIFAGIARLECGGDASTSRDLTRS
jgi:hypothetical protein